MLNELLRRLWRTSRGRGNADLRRRRHDGLKPEPLPEHSDDHNAEQCARSLNRPQDVVEAFNKLINSSSVDEACKKIGTFPGLYAQTARDQIRSLLDEYDSTLTSSSFGNKDNADAIYIQGHYYLSFLDRCFEAGVDSAREDLRAIDEGLDRAPLAVLEDLVSTREVNRLSEKLRQIVEMKLPLDQETIRRYATYMIDPRTRPLLEAYVELVQDAQRRDIKSAVDEFLTRGSPRALLDAFQRFVRAEAPKAQKEIFDAFAALSDPRTHDILKAWILLEASDDRDKRSVWLAALWAIIRYTRGNPDEVLADSKVNYERNLARKEVYALVELKDHIRICDYLAAKPGIVTPEALATLDELVELQEADLAQRYVRQIRDLFVRALSVGPEQAVREMRGGNLNQQAVLNKLESFLQLSDGDDRRRFLQKHPEIYSADALELFDRVTTAPENKVALGTRLALLRECRDVGVHAATSRIRDPALVSRIAVIHAMVDQAHASRNQEAFKQCVVAWDNLVKSNDLASESADAQCYVHNGYAHACVGLSYLTKDHSLDAEAIVAWRCCNALTGDATGEYRANLGVILEAAFNRTGEKEALHQALETAIDAADTKNFTATVLAIRLAKDCLGLFGETKYVGRACELGFEFIDSEAIRPTDVGGVLIELAELLSVRATDQDAENSAECLRRAESLLDPVSEEYTAYQLALAGRLLQNFKETGHSRLLSDCIELAERLTTVPTVNPGAAHATLARAYRSRYELTRDVSDVDRAVQVAEDAIGIARDRWRELPLRLQTLAISLQVRYEATGNAEDLNDAVHHLRRAIGLSDGQQIRRDTWEYTLSSILRLRFRALKDRSDLDEAIEISSRLGRSSQGALLRMLVPAGARALRDRYEATGDIQDLEAAIASLDAHIEQDGENAEAHRVLSELLRLKCSPERNRDLEASIVLHFRKSCELRSGKNDAEMWRSAAQLGVWAASRGLWDVAADSLLDASRGFLTQFQHSAFLPNSNDFLEEVDGLASLTAFSLAKAERRIAAAEFMLSSNAHRLAGASIGRWSLIERAGTLGATPLAGEMAQLAREWDGYVRLSNETDLTRNSANVARIDFVRNRLEQLSNEIGEITGIEVGASRASPIDLIRRLSGDGLVAVAFSVLGGCAIMVSPQGVTSTQLYEALTTSVLEGILRRNFNAYGYFRETGQGEALWSQELQALLRWCREEIVAPLLGTISQWEGATLVAIGAANLLPLHVALAWADPREKHDQVVLSSYLAHGDLLNDPQPGNLQGRNFAAFYDPVSSQPRLIGANAEALTIKHVFLGAEMHGGELATRAALVSALSQCREIHISCHAEAIPPQPLRSCIHLARDERLELYDIMNLDLRNLDLVVLSCCESALPGFKLLDEVISLPTAFLSRGASCVIASGWAVPDYSTAVLFCRFYHNISAARSDVRTSLAEAQRWLRTAHKKEIADFIRKAQSSATDIPMEWEVVISAVLDEEDDVPYKDPISWAAMSVYGLPRLRLL